jgi:uncharacterized protein YcfL
MKKTFLFALIILVLTGCSTANPNAVMMDKVVGELDRETSK